MAGKRWLVVGKFALVLPARSMTMARSSMLRCASGSYCRMAMWLVSRLCTTWVFGTPSGDW